MLSDPRLSNLAGARVLVTGGCGFIGSHLVQQLLALGASAVHVVDSLRYGKRENLGAAESQVSVIEFTLGVDPIERLHDALSDSDYLVHLAAEKHNQSKDTPEAVLAANVVGTQALFAAAEAHGVRRSVFSSSLYAYGRMAGERMDESLIPTPHTIYGITKLTGEHMLRFHSSQGSMSGVSLRYFFAYGPNQFAGLGYKSVIAKNFERIVQGQPPVIFGDGEQSLDYVFVDDVVEATLLALVETSTPDVMNIASGVPRTINDLTAAMLKVAGSTLSPEYGPADWTAGSRRVGEPALATSALGWQAHTSLEEGLARTLSWVRSSST